MSLKRVVVDTNVFISAMLISSSVPAKVVEYVLSECELIVSKEILSELETRIQRKKFDAYINKEDRTNFIDQIKRVSIVVPISGSVQASVDKDDDKFLEAAVNSKSRFIITGDTDLLDLHPYDGVQILQPAKFLRLMTQ